MFATKSQHNRINRLVRLTGLWAKEDSNGNQFYTGEVLDVGNATSEKATEAIAHLSSQEMDALVGLQGKRINVFANHSKSDGDYRMLIADPAPRGTPRSETPLWFVAPLNVTQTGKAIRGKFSPDAVSKTPYSGLLSMKGTLVITEVSVKRSEKDADFILSYDPAPRKREDQDEKDGPDGASQDVPF